MGLHVGLQEFIIQITLRLGGSSCCLLCRAALACPEHLAPITAAQPDFHINYRRKGPLVSRDDQSDKNRPHPPL